VFDITRPHLASFAATVNGDDFLTDASGSRRFLSFHIENCNIDELKKVDLPKAYSEAYQEYLNGFRYWFTDEEIKEIDEKNQEFTTVSIELELIEKLYDLENPKEEFYSAGGDQTIY
jgi:predicted P-loop ATPase